MNDFRSGFGPDRSDLGRSGEPPSGYQTPDPKFRYDYPAVPRFSGPAPDDAAERRRQPIFSAPAVIKWLLFGFWGVYFFLIFAPRSVGYELGRYFALSPLDLFDTGGRIGPIDKAAGLIGHMFLHSGFQHIATNSLLFIAFGVPVVRRLAAGGRQMPVYVESLSPNRAAPRSSILFLAFFLLSGAAGALAFAALYANSSVLLIGASGGVSGLFGGLVRILNRRAPQFTPGQRPLAALTDPVVLILTAVFIAVNIAQGVFGLGVGLDGGGEEIDIAWEAHLGGYFFGLIAFPFFDALSRTGRRDS